jgi:antitoxin HicB
MYTLALARDDNGTVLVTCPDLSEVTTFGEDKEDAMHRAVDAIEEALAARIAPARGHSGPFASAALDDEVRIQQYPFVRCGNSVRIGFSGRSAVGARRSQGRALSRGSRGWRLEGGIGAPPRLAWPQVDRLFDLNHRSTIEHLDQALRAIGKRLEVNIEDAA